MDRPVDILIFVVCSILLLGFTIDAAYDFGHRHGVASVRCAPVPKQMSYPKTKAEMKAWVKTYQAGRGI